MSDDLAARLAGTNISAQTFLATDYLNHFNEVVMLMGMLADMPEMFEDIQAWAPKTYAEHFRDSTFSDRDLAIEAYGAAPARYRQPFDATIAQLNDAIGRAVVLLRPAIEANETERIAVVAGNATLVLQKLIDVASGIIHGSEKGMSQAEVDTFMSVD